MVDALPYFSSCGVFRCRVQRRRRRLAETKAAGDPHLGMKHSRNLAGTGLKGIRASLEQKWIWQNPQNETQRLPAARAESRQPIDCYDKNSLKNIFLETLSTLS